MVDEITGADRYEVANFNCALEEVQVRGPYDCPTSPRVYQEGEYLSVHCDDSHGLWTMSGHHGPGEVDFVPPAVPLVFLFEVTHEESAQDADERAQHGKLSRERSKGRHQRHRKRANQCSAEEPEREESGLAMRRWWRGHVPTCRFCIRVKPLTWAVRRWWRGHVPTVRNVGPGSKWGDLASREELPGRREGPGRGSAHVRVYSVAIGQRGDTEYYSLTFTWKPALFNALTNSAASNSPAPSAAAGRCR